LHFEWKETGGPAAKQSAPAGFGSALIESAIPGGQVKRQFRGDGLVCTIEVPLPPAVGAD
jgi:two-component system CheB/CheR fusion protein